MAMGAAKGTAATLQVEMVCLDELVPADDRYRRLDELVDSSFVREAAAPYYSDEAPSLDPTWSSSSRSAATSRGSALTADSWASPRCTLISAASSATASKIA